MRHAAALPLPAARAATPAAQRILHVIARQDRGGTEVACLTLCGALHAGGAENHIVALTRGGGAITAADAATLHPALPAGRAARMAAFARLVLRLKPDGIVFHVFHADHVTLGAVARATGVRRLAAVQGNPVPAHPRGARTAALLLAATRLLGMPLISASHTVAASMRTAGRLPARSAVVHNATALAPLPRPRRCADAPLVAGMVARLDPIKDHATLLAAVARMPDTIAGRPVHLHIVGDGPLRGRLEAEAKCLGIAHRTVFRGTRADIAAELAGWDAFVLSTTRDEGFGIVLIEALAAGVPVLASDVPACREVLDGGALGRLVPAADPDALAAALAGTLAAPPPVPDLAAVAERYGPARMAHGYRRVLFPGRSTTRAGGAV